MQETETNEPQDDLNFDVLGRIHRNMATLSKTQTKIASSILSYPRLFVEKPIEELVPWIGVSAPTITRFCRSMGCDGLRDMKLKIMGAMRVGARYLEHPVPSSSFENLREQAAIRAQNGIADAMRVPADVIEKAIDRLLNARVIYAFGSGGVSSWLVDEIQNRFFRLGLTVVPCRDGIMQGMFAATTRKDDVLVCCSLSGNNRIALEAMQIAQEYGAYCITLCPPGTGMEAAADLAVPVETHDEGDVLGPTAARYSMLFTIDLIAFGAAIRTSTTSTESLRRLKQQFVSHVDANEMRPLSD